MYSFNHSVRYCSVLNLDIIITQMVLPNQSKHMDMILRELHGYYAAHLAHTRTPTHKHTRNFPKVKQIPSFQKEITSHSSSRSFLRAGDPLYPSGCCRFMHQHRHTHTYKHTHLSVTQQRCQHGSEAVSDCVKIACCKRIRQLRQQRLEWIF